MYLIIQNVLGARQLEQISSLLKQAEFVDGKLSAGMEAKRVKNNLEVKPSDSSLDRLNHLVMNSLVQHPEYQAAVFPYRVATPFYARYTEGMGYGNHVDDPVMGPMTGRYRSDVATTVFLNQPDDYEGGELQINTPFGEKIVKLPAGDAVVYPSSSWHSVQKVTQGERLVAVTWTQSMVRDPAQRELLYELGTARDRLLKSQPDADETGKVSTAYVNLLRMWSEV